MSKLTPDQLKNWRNYLTQRIGVAAFFVSDEQIEALRDKIQAMFGTDLSNPVPQQPAICACDPKRYGKTVRRDGRVTCNKCNRERAE